MDFVQYEIDTNAFVGLSDDPNDVDFYLLMEADLGTVDLSVEETNHDEIIQAILNDHDSDDFEYDSIMYHMWDSYDLDYVYYNERFYSGFEATTDLTEQLETVFG